MLLAGVAIGVLIGFTVGSGNAVEQNVVAAGFHSIERTEAPGGRDLDRSSPSNAMGPRSSLEADLDAPLAPASLRAGGANDKMLLAIAADAELAPSAGELDAADPSRMISGLVNDDQGKPLAGVTIQATMNPSGSTINTRSARSIGQGWEGETDLAESLRKQATSTLQQRRLKRIAVSDADGRFQLTNLLPGRHRLYAYGEGYVFQSRRAYVGGTTSFTGTLAQQFHLEIVDGEGAPITEATIGVAEGNRWRYYEWSAKEPTLFLRERSARLRAFAGGPLLGDTDKPFAKLASDERTIILDVDGAGPHRFTVTPTLSLCVSVVDRTTDGPIIAHEVRYASAKKLQEAGGRSSFTKHSKEISMDADGRFRVPALEAGDYVLGVARMSDKPEVFREFSIVASPVEETIELPPISADDFLIVQAYSPGGATLSGLGFSLWVEGEGRVYETGLSSTERTMGEHWMKRARHAMNREGPATLIVKSPAFGSTMVPVGRDQGRLRVDFLEPCDLRVEVVADADATFKVSLQVKTSLGDAPPRTLASDGPNVTKGQGFVTFRGLQPGTAELTLQAENNQYQRYNRSKLAFAEVPLRPGEQVATLTATTLHTLEVHAPNEPVGTTFSASALADPGGTALGGYQYGTLDKEHVLRLEDLAPGRYKLSPRDGQAPVVEVTVPSSAITYERPATTGYRVTARRKGRDMSPLAPDDIITEVNGESVAVGSLNSRIGLAVAEGPTTLTLIRDGKTIELPIESSPSNVRYTPIASLE